MTRILLLAGVGLGVFLMSICGTLVVQGKLNSEGLSQAGVLSLFFEASPPEPGESEQQPVATVSALRPYTTKEINRLIRDLREQRGSYQARKKELEVAERRQTSFRQGLSAMKKQIVTARQELAQQAAALGQREAALKAKLVLIKQSEEVNLKKAAAVYEGMSAQAASKALLEMEETTVAKIVSQMDERKAAKLLEALPPAAAAKLTERLRNLVHEQSGT